MKKEFALEKVKLIIIYAYNNNSNYNKAATDFLYRLKSRNKIAIPEISFEILSINTNNPGWENKIELDEGIEKDYEWYKKHLA